MKRRTLTLTPRRTAIALTAASLATLGSGIVAVHAHAAAEPGKPNFLLPFECGKTARLSTYPGHNPDDKKLDMFRTDAATEGSPVVASAAGTVHQVFTPGGVEIDHGNGWFTVYIHMRDRVAVGTRVEQGQRIGTASNVGTKAPHLHYEQLKDKNGDGDGEVDEMEYPTIQGQTFRLNPNDNDPNNDSAHMTSTNGCSGEDKPKPNDDKPEPDDNKPKPYDDPFQSPEIDKRLPAEKPDQQRVRNDSRYWIDTYDKATGYRGPSQADPQGTLFKGTHYVYCKVKGEQLRDGANYNHWWLKTDLDAADPGKSGKYAYVSALYLTRWGNDEAKDNAGKEIPDC